MMFKVADGMDYYEFLNRIHGRYIFNDYFEIGSRDGKSLRFSNSPSIAIDPFFQLKSDFLGNKDYTLLFQEKSEEFFKNTIKQFPHLSCEFAFIDGLHLFEAALRDFVNLNSIAKSNALFLFHDCLPWNYEMTTRDYHSLAKNAPWTGDIWKLIPIFLDAGMSNEMCVIPSAPSGILAVINPKKNSLRKLEEHFKAIESQWKNISLEQYGLNEYYRLIKYKNAREFLDIFDSFKIGKKQQKIDKKWVSH